jgi:hypothetical protein
MVQQVRCDVYQRCHQHGVIKTRQSKRACKLANSTQPYLITIAGNVALHSAVCVIGWRSVTPAATGQLLLAEVPGESEAACKQRKCTNARTADTRVLLQLSYCAG